MRPADSPGMMPSEPRFLMCRPSHFAVTYAINPWMDPDTWARDGRALGAAAWRQWAGLHQTLCDLGAAIELVPPVPCLPDLVFTANSAVVLDRTALLARFRHPERRREGPHVAAAFRVLLAKESSTLSAACRSRSCSRAPETAFSTRPAICSGWATVRARMRLRGMRSRRPSGWEWLRSS